MLIVSGDSDLLVLHPFGGIQILLLAKALRFAAQDRPA